MWDTVLEQLKEIVTRPSFETWLKDTLCIGMNRETVFIEAPNTFVAEMLEDRMYTLIRSTVQDVLGYEVDVDFVVLANEISPNGVASSTE